MANLNIAKIVDDIFGNPSQRIYHQDLMVPDGQGPRLKIDWLGLGEFRFDLDKEDSNGVEWADEYTDQGLFVSVSRGEFSENTNTMGHHGVLPNEPLSMPTFELPTDFVLTASFVRPKKTARPSPNPDPARPGEYAAVVLFDYESPDSSTDYTAQAGVTSRFTDATGDMPQLHVNVVPYGKRFWPNPTNPPLGGFPPIADYWCKQVTADVDPSVFTVVLYVKRSEPGAPQPNGAHFHAWLYIGDKCVQSTLASPVPEQMFDYMTPATAFKNIRVGIGTSQGMGPRALNYTASVYLTDFAIWSPPIYYRDFRPREVTNSVTGPGGWFTVQQDKSSGPYVDLGTRNDDGINLQTTFRDPAAGSALYSHFATLKSSDFGNPFHVPKKFQLRATFRYLETQRQSDLFTNPTPTAPGGDHGDEFEVTIVLKSAYSWVEGRETKHPPDVEFKMQTTDKTTSGRGVRLFVDRSESSGWGPQEEDFLRQTAFDSLYDSSNPTFTLNAIINTGVLDSTAYLEFGGNRYEMVRPFNIPIGFIEAGLTEIRVRISSSKGNGLVVSARLYEFEIIA